MGERKEKKRREREKGFFFYLLSSLLSYRTHCGVCHIVPGLFLKEALKLLLSIFIIYYYYHIIQKGIALLYMQHINTNTNIHCWIFFFPLCSIREVWVWKRRKKSEFASKVNKNWIFVLASLSGNLKCKLKNVEKFSLIYSFSDQKSFLNPSTEILLWALT